MSVLAIPNPDSYVLEWEAIQLAGDGSNLSAVKRMLKNSPWVGQMDVLETGILKFVFTRTHGGGGVEQWKLDADDWIVRSPFDKFWFMGPAEFHSQFRTVDR